MNNEETSSYLGGPALRTDAATRRAHAHELIYGIRKVVEEHPGGVLDLEAVSHVRASCKLLRHCYRGDATAIAKTAELEQFATQLYRGLTGQKLSPDELRDQMRGCCDMLGSAALG